MTPVSDLEIALPGMSVAGVILDLYAFPAAEGGQPWARRSRRGWVALTT